MVSRAGPRARGTHGGIIGFLRLGFCKAVAFQGFLGTLSRLSLSQTHNATRMDFGALANFVVALERDHQKSTSWHVDFWWSHPSGSLFFNISFCL